MKVLPERSYAKYTFILIILKAVLSKNVSILNVCVGEDTKHVLIGGI